MTRGSEKMSSIVRASRRREIAEAARRLFGERGSLDVSVDEIAEAAELARSSVYTHFADRDEILRAALALGHDELIGSLESEVRDVSDPIERLVVVFRVLLEQIDQSPLFWRLALSLSASERNADAAPVTAEIVVVSAEVSEVITTAVRDAVDAGRLRAEGGLGNLLAFVGQQLSGLVHQRVVDPQAEAPDATARRVWELLLGGIGA